MQFEGYLLLHILIHVYNLLQFYFLKKIMFKTESKHFSRDSFFLSLLYLFCLKPNYQLDCFLVLSENLKSFYLGNFVADIILFLGHHKNYQSDIFSMVLQRGSYCIIKIVNISHKRIISRSLLEDNFSPK